MANVSNSHPFAMPTVQLNAGWNLIGPNPLFNYSGMPADQVLASVVQTPDGKPGYTQVISPQVKGQRAWIFVPGTKDAPSMESGRGYWIWMQNPDTLAGFGFTPLTDMLLKMSH